MKMQHHNKSKKNKNILYALLICATLMFAFGYALVPVYNVICKTLGINGKPNSTASHDASWIDNSRSITVEFLANTNANLPWTFYPRIKKIEIHPGQNTILAYYAKNNSDHVMTIQAIPSVSPGQAAIHLKKTECFCFRQQTLKPHQEILMPLIFHLDNKLPKDINEVTLSYTLFTARKLSRDTRVGKIQS